MRVLVQRSGIASVKVDGKTFGKEYSSFIRMNLACPRSQVTASLEALKAYFD